VAGPAGGRLGALVRIEVDVVDAPAAARSERREAEADRARERGEQVGEERQGQRGLPARSSEEQPDRQDTRIPASLTIASTVSTEVGAPLLRAKNRSVGCSSVMHVAGDVAELPAGSESELRSLDELTENDSFPATSLAPPVSDQPVAFSSEPFWSST